MPVTPLLLSLVLLGQAESNDESFAAMQKRVEPTRISVLHGVPAKSTRADDGGARPDVGTGEGANALLVKTPVIRYSDEIRRIEDAGVWLWTERGRPVAAMKVERYKAGTRETPWLYCFTSLSSDLIRAEWVDAAPFQSRQSGVKWQSLDDEPAKTRPARLVQLRQMARRFSGEILVDPERMNRIQLRLLPRPLLRYDESTNVLDGAIFAFAGTGTNPDVLLLFDLLPDGGWRFGVASMTAEGVTLKLNDQVVYEYPHTAGKGTIFDTWCYFSPAK